MNVFLKNKFATAVIGVTACVWTGLIPSGASAQNVLHISDQTANPVIILPESFETDTRKMLENWYLQNYAVLDYDADSRPSVEVTDDVLIERLGKLPAEIEMPFNSVVKNSIIFYATRRKQLVENMLGLSLYYMPIFDEALDRYQMPRELRYLPVIESALEPTAQSRAGAVGLWQFMNGTATGLGLEVNSLVDERRDPYASSDAAARYLKQLYQTYGDWSLAIAAYNCGSGNVNKAMRRAGGGKLDFWAIYPFLPAETRGYLPAFIAANYIMTYYKEHNISPALARRPIVTDTVHVTRRVHFEQIADVMGIPISEIRTLNPQYKKDVIPGDIRPYPLILPSLQTLAYVANEDSIVNHNTAKYARRGVVEPASGNVTGSDARGEYVDELVTQYHTVRKGETLTKIARKYGVTVAAIRKLNKCGKTVKRGRRLKIQTYKRRYIESRPEQPVETADTANIPLPEVQDAPQDTTATVVEMPADTAVATDTVAATGSGLRVDDAPSTPAATEEPAPAASKKKSTSKSSPAMQYHRVRKGENLFKIAKRYGTTVDKLKAVNKLSSDNINVGQRLLVPNK